MKWYHYIVPILALHAYINMDNAFGSLVLLLGLPFFWLYPLIEKFIGKEPEHDSYEVDLELYNNSNRTTPPTPTKRTRKFHWVTVFCWLLLFFISANWHWFSFIT